MLISSRIKVRVFPVSDEIVLQYFTIFAPVIFFSALYYVNWLYQQGTSIYLLINSTETIRAIVDKSSWDKKLSAIFAYQAYGAIPLVLSRFNVRLHGVARLFLLSSIFLMALAVILQGGRTFFLSLFALSYAWFVLSDKCERRERFRSLQFKVLLTLTVIVSFAAIAFIALFRPGEAEILDNNSRSEMRYEVPLLSDPNQRYLLLSLLDYSVAPTFDFFRTIESENYLARLTPGPARAVLSRFTDGVELTNYEKENIANFSKLGGFSSAWRSAYGNFIVWYGYVGQFILAMAVGILVGVSIKKSKVKNTLYTRLSASWAIYLYLFCFLYFPSDSIFLINATIVWMVFPLLSLFRKSRKILL
jgi:hypothetical protein